MKNYTGYMIVATLVSYLVSVIFPPVLFITTVIAWLVPVLMWRSLSKSALQQASVLLFLGFIAIVFSATKGVFPGWGEIFSVNLPLLAMFVAVAFLTLTNQSFEDPNLPKGNKAVITTALGTHFLGGVINLSVLFVFVHFGTSFCSNYTKTNRRKMEVYRCNRNGRYYRSSKIR